MNTQIVRSPLNYTGSKYKLLPELLKLFPDNINCFIDLFGGSGNISANVKANKIVYNDIEKHIYELLVYLKDNPPKFILDKIYNIIDDYKLSKYNKEGYLELRDSYNKSDDKDVITFYVLTCYSFNHQIRFNSKGKYNVPFGNRAFNNNIEENLLNFTKRLRDINIQFTNCNFEEYNNEVFYKDDFVYCDPPYLITTASYNENGGWSEESEIKLYSFLDKINKEGIRFGLSNVFESNGKENKILKNWADGYNIYYLDSSYHNCNYHRKNKSKDIEVYICNY